MLDVGGWEEVGDCSDYPEIVSPMSGSIPSSLNCEANISPFTPMYYVESFSPFPKDVRI